MQIDPRQRPTIATLVENIEDLAIGNDIGLNEPLLFLFNENENLNTANPSGGSNPQRPPVMGNNPSSSSSHASVSSYLPSSLKGLNTSGKSWMKSIIDTSSKVINEGVQQVKTLANNVPAAASAAVSHHSHGQHQMEVDLSYISSKIIVMTTPRDNPSDLSGRQSAELIRDLLDTKHSQSYMLFSLDQPSRHQPTYRKEIFHNRVIELPISDEKHPPRLIDLLCLCQKITSFLLDAPANTAVLHSHVKFNLFEKSNFEILCLGWTKSSCIWRVCVDCLSWNISTG